MYSLSINQVLQILEADGSLNDYLAVSRMNEDGFLSFEERHCENRTNVPAINNMFGQLEHLDIGHIGKSGYKIAGCLAAISWLSGGRIRELNIAGLEKLNTVELNFFAMCSGERLKVLEAPVSLTVPPLGTEMNPTLLTIFPFYVPSMITELDLSCLDVSVIPSDSTALSFLSKLANCRVLKLDHVPVKEVHLPPMSGLLKLSLLGCTQLTRNSIYNYLQTHHRDSKILELDIRGISDQTDLPLNIFCKVLPRLVMLNNRRTKLGTALKDEHLQLQRWRTGAKIQKVKSRKRKSHDGIPPENEVISARAESMASVALASSAPGLPPSMTCCSLFRTGFKKDRETEQEMFACWTCKIDFGRFVCYECAKNCHKGHDLVPIGFGAGHCDCSILSQCSCL